MYVKNIKKVALFVESSRVNDQELLLGISQYNSFNAAWELIAPRQVYISKSKPKRRSVSWFKRQGIDGVIYSSPFDPKEILSLGVPCIIHTDMEDETPPWPNIRVDHKALSKMAADYFLRKGFRNFGYCGIDIYPWSKERGNCFSNEIQKAGYEVDIYRSPKSKIDRMWENEQPFIIQWIKSLAKPVAILTCNDTRGQFLIETCKMADIIVPDQVAILGVDNDKVICGISSPPLSSIELNTQKAGYEAAKLLDRLMSGESPRSQKIIIKPVRIATRRSTDITAVKDRDVAAALKFIRENSQNPVQVEEVAEAVSVSKRTLQRKFLQHLGRPIGQEIRKLRVEKISVLLIETNMSIEQIARKSGCSDTSHMIRIFKKHAGMTPLTYRRTFRAKI